MVAGLGDGMKDTRDRALLLIGFAGAFRRSELVAIDCNDVAWQPEGIVITVRRSKTDTDRRGRKVAITYARGEPCPVKVLDSWLKAAGSAGPHVHTWLEWSRSTSCGSIAVQPQRRKHK